MNGRVVGDLDGKYTCHEYNGSSTVDYFIVQVENYDKVVSMKVLDLPWYSDHCPLSVVMKVGIYNRSSAVDNMNNYITRIKNYKWSEDSKQEYIETLGSQKIKELLDRFLEYDADDIDHMTSELTDIIISAADLSLETKNTKNNGSFRSNTRQNYMKFDSHCQNLKKEFNRCRRKFVKRKVRSSFFSARSKFRQAVKSLKRNGKESKLHALQELEKKS